MPLAPNSWEGGEECVWSDKHCWNRTRNDIVVSDHSSDQSEDVFTTLLTTCAVLDADRVSEIASVLHNRGRSKRSGLAQGARHPFRRSSRRCETSLLVAAHTAYCVGQWRPPRNRSLQLGRFSTWPWCPVCTRSTRGQIWWSSHRPAWCKANRSADVYVLRHDMYTVDFVCSTVCEQVFVLLAKKFASFNSSILSTMSLRV